MLAERVVVEAAVCEVDDKAKDGEDDDDEVEPAEYMLFDARRYTESYGIECFLKRDPTRDQLVFKVQDISGFGMKK